MKTKEEIKNKISKIRYEKKKFLEDDNEPMYKAYCKVENLLIWVIDGEYPMKEKQETKLLKMEREKGFNNKSLILFGNLKIRPKIKSSKKDGKNKHIFSTFLRKEDKQFLFNKYQKKGLSYEDAHYKIKLFILKLKYIEDKLRKKIQKNEKTKEEINKNFKRKFEELCQQLDSES